MAHPQEESGCHDEQCRLNGECLTHSHPETTAEAEAVPAQETIDEDEDVFEIPSVDELMANPTPSTSRGIVKRLQNKKKKNFLFPNLDRCRMGSLLVYGEKLFKQGVDIDALISETIDELAQRRSAREVLETKEIENEVGAQRLYGAQRMITEQIANLVDRLQYLNGRRYRLLEVLQAQQDRLDEFVNMGLDNRSFMSPPTQSVEPTGVLPNPREFWHGLERDVDHEEEVPETEPTTPSHYSSNLSIEVACAPGDCRCEDRKCENFNYTN